MEGGRVVVVVVCVGRRRLVVWVGGGEEGVDVCVCAKYNFQLESPAGAATSGVLR